MLNLTNFFEFLLCALHTYLGVRAVWRVVDRDKGGSRFTRVGLVIVMYLIATSALAARWIFVQSINDDGTQGTTYIHSPGWILLSSMTFMADILVTSCLTIWQCCILSGRKWMFAVIPGLCIIAGTTFAGFGLYQMTGVTPPPGNACAAQIDWAFPYFAIVLAVTVLCALVIIYRVEEETRWRYIKVIVVSLLSFAAGPIIFLVVCGMRMSCPLPAMTMSAGLTPVLAMLWVPSDTMTPKNEDLELQDGLVTEGNAGPTSSENQKDSSVSLQEAAISPAERDDLSNGS